jgi:hypothetical protein
MRARKRAQGTASLNTLRIIDNAKDEYAIENSKGNTTTPTGTDLYVYVKKGSKLYTDLIANKPVDALGAAITIGAIDTPPKVAAATKTALSDALGGANANDFWGAYQ